MKIFLQEGKSYLEFNKNYCPVDSTSVLSMSKILERVSEGRINILSSIRSTNQYIIDNLQYIRSGDVFVSEHQTQGRGRRGKIWISSNGKSICLSIYWKLFYKPPITIEFSLMISCIVSRVLRSLGIPRIQIKWPNDLYVDGKKLAGVLVEIITNNSKVAHLVIGIGINTSICTYDKLKYLVAKNWTDLKSIGINVDSNLLVVNLVNTLRYQLKLFEKNKCMSFIYYYKIVDYLYNKPVELFIDDHIDYGIASGINPYGALSILNKLGTTRYYTGNNVSVRLV